MKPLRDIILIEPDKPPEKSAAGLYIVEEWKSLPPSGTVKAVGPEVTKVKPGDRVIFERYGSIIFNKETRLCKESQILGFKDED